LPVGGDSARHGLASVAGQKEGYLMAGRRRRRRAASDARPTLVTLLSVFLGLSAVYSVWLVMSGRLVFRGWYLGYYIIGIPCMALVVVGLWRMRKWAVWIYAAILLSAISLVIIRHKWKWTNVAGPLIALAIMGANYRRMK
jgi:hypothetical protein